ncbi:MAG: dodecin family protein [Actinobacteria bacterium]|nr:dodecin family protein [Actinomycetota bacterium]
MHIKVTEMVGESTAGWKDAVQSAVSEASRSLNEIVGVEVVNFTANVENGRVVEYKANLKVAHKT